MTDNPLDLLTDPVLKEATDFFLQRGAALLATSGRTALRRFMRVSRSRQSPDGEGLLTNPLNSGDLQRELAIRPSADETDRLLAALGTLTVASTTGDRQAVVDALWQTRVVLEQLYGRRLDLLDEQAHPRAIVTNSLKVGPVSGRATQIKAKRLLRGSIVSTVADVAEVKRRGEFTGIEIDEI